MYGRLVFFNVLYSHLSYSACTFYEIPPTQRRRDEIIIVGAAPANKNAGRVMAVIYFFFLNRFLTIFPRVFFSLLDKLEDYTLNKKKINKYKSAKVLLANLWIFLAAKNFSRLNRELCPIFF